MGFSGAGTRVRGSPGDAFPRHLHRFALNGLPTEAPGVVSAPVGKGGGSRRGRGSGCRSSGVWVKGRLVPEGWKGEVDNDPSSGGAEQNPALPFLSLFQL